MNRLQRASFWMACIAALIAFLLIGSVPVLRADPNATALPTNTRRPSPTALSTFIATPAPGPLGGGDYGTWTPQPRLQPFGFTEHFVMARPIGADGVNYLARNYPYGGMDGGGRPVHHGDDFENPAGTPILAAADGVVDYAGDDVRVVYGPQPNFYGNVVVIKHKFLDASGQAVYSLYGHLSRILTGTGKLVKQGDIIGLVGSAGVAVGAHLHFEVRVGQSTDYTATRNPELWIRPFSTFGAIAGRVTDANGQIIHSVLVQAQYQGLTRQAETYGDDNVPGDSVLGENFVMSDMPSGYYLVFIRASNDALLYRNTVYVQPYKVTWVDIHIAP